MDLQWVPNKPDQLITWSQDITLYKVEDVQNGIVNELSPGLVKGPCKLESHFMIKYLTIAKVTVTTSNSFSFYSSHI